MSDDGKTTRITEPAAIEARSMEIIDEELRTQGVRLAPDDRELIVLRRVIHATADFDFAKNLAFVGDAADAGILALARGVPIVTDTNMAKAGVSRPALERLGSSAHCFVADPDVAEAAREAQSTRAVMAMRKALRLHPDAILAVGNAPTALFELCEHLHAGAQPALVIAVPVGFVNVVEAKEETLALCKELGVPAIVARGRKGGSTVATAIANALLYEATRTK